MAPSSKGRFPQSGGLRSVEQMRHSPCVRAYMMGPRFECLIEAEVQVSHRSCQRRKPGGQACASYLRAYSGEQSPDRRLCRALDSCGLRSMTYLCSGLWRQPKGQRLTRPLSPRERAQMYGRQESRGVLRGCRTEPFPRIFFRVRAVYLETGQ